MNKQIEKLALECGAWHQVYEPKRFLHNHNFDIERFAELIVRECLGCCEQVISDPVPKSVDTWLNGGSQCIDEIKQHFGVEE